MAFCLQGAASSLWDGFSCQVVWSLYLDSCASTEGQALGRKNVLVAQFGGWGGERLFSA